MMKLNFRQGDVGFVEKKVPEDAKRIPFRPFALGEVTGHSHCVVGEDVPLCEMYEKDGVVYVRALGDLRVQHQDHDPSGSVSVLPKGWEGEIVIAKEYDEGGDFRVCD